MSRKQAIADYDYFIRQVGAIHPDCFGNISRIEFLQKAKTVREQMPAKIERKTFSLVVGENAALFNDAHTGVNFWYHPDYRKHVQSGGKFFPFVMKNKGDRMFVQSWPRGLKVTNIAKGDEIISVNGQKIQSMMNRYARYLSGERVEQKYVALEYLFGEFIWLCEGEHEKFELVLKSSDNHTYSETVPAVTKDAYKTTAKTGAKDSTFFSYRFYDSNEICLFKAQSFGNHLRERYNKQLDQMFCQMKKNQTKILIVDLRNNGGGNGGFGEELLKRAGKAYRTGPKIWRYSESYQKACLIGGLRKYKIPAWMHLENILDMRDFGWGPASSQLVDEMWYPPDGGPTKPYKDAWQGEMILVCNRHTFSAASTMAVIVKDNKIGLIAGEETGGMASCFSEIASIFLPNSGLEVRISSAYFPRPGGYDDGHGVMPDIVFDPEQNDNLVVEQILNYINANRNKIVN